MTDLDPIAKANKTLSGALWLCPCSAKKQSKAAIAWRDKSVEKSLHRLIDAYSRLVISTASKFPTMACQPLI